MLRADDELQLLPRQWTKLLIGSLRRYGDCERNHTTEVHYLPSLADNKRCRQQMMQTTNDADTSLLRNSVSTVSSLRPRRAPGPFSGLNKRCTSISSVFPNPCQDPSVKNNAYGSKRLAMPQMRQVWVNRLCFPSKKLSTDPFLNPRDHRKDFGGTFNGWDSCGCAGVAVDKERNSLPDQECYWTWG